ncbi:MAG: hypothetical protein JWO36_6700 [Myxococcales bacterium]|nr:hypothetical protein [Myxococcales bacterium]
MPSRSWLFALLVACGGTAAPTVDDAAVIGGDVRIEADASTTLPSTFRIGIVGDTRPANEDDLAGYPTAVITKIWADLEAATPHPDLAISTGDYMFANPSAPPATSTVNKMLDRYLGARATFTKAVFAAFGNHECTGATASNCGPGSRDGVTQNYTAYLTRMINPLGITLPYFSYAFHASDSSWTAKLVVIAANAWNPTQAAWLDSVLAQPTTYTFVVRHESASANTAPGVTPSETIIAKYPLTLKIVGHTHTYQHVATDHEVICGNGGAPLTSGTNYGYAILERLASGVIQFTEYDYMTNANRAQWRINADGTPAP